MMQQYSQSPSIHTGWPFEPNNGLGFGTDKVGRHHHQKLQSGLTGFYFELTPKRVVKEIQRISDGQKCGVGCGRFWPKKTQLTHYDAPRPTTVIIRETDAAVQPKPINPFWVAIRAKRWTWWL
jgi:hypothetical protein